MIYNLLISILLFFLKFVSIFNLRAKTFINTRNNINQKLSNNIKKKDKVLWFHCSSLGEFEQARPLIDYYFNNFSKYKILITFFSQSGYDIQKNYKNAHIVSYLPFDKKNKIKNFLDCFKPKILFLIKYEFWPELINQTKKRKVKIYSISSVFRKNQIYFKIYGLFFKKVLRKIDHFFLNDLSSSNLLKDIGILNTSVVGNTKFDRALKILSNNTEIEYVSKFKSNKMCLVLGSVWKKDLEIILKNLNELKNLKIIIAPHKPDKEHLDYITKNINSNYSLFSSKKKSFKSKILIVDNVGSLNKIYKYADIAYVGGGMGKSGIHNTIEPAVYKIPVIVGKNFSKDNDTKELVDLKGIVSIQNSNEFIDTLTFLIKNKKNRNKMGGINYKYILSKSGSVEKIINKINLK